MFTYCEAINRVLEARIVHLLRSHKIVLEARIIHIL